MESERPEGTSESEAEQEYTSGVRLIVLNLPEDEGEGLGFRLTRTLWDPYPWVREVVPESRADSAGLKTGDCLLQADGKDLLGLPVGQVAGLIRGDGSGRGVSLLCWNCGVDPTDDPELLWSCGGGGRGERARRALAGVLRALACCVCAATATRALACARSHLYCESCWSRLDRCALCRESLPPKDSPYARNLVAEQVFEAIATEYEIKDAAKNRTRTTSAFNSPTRSPARSPSGSPSASRKGQYQLSMMNRRRAQYGDKCASDPNIRRSLDTEHTSAAEATSSQTTHKCCCSQNINKNTDNPGSIPKISVQQVDSPDSQADCQGVPGGASQGMADCQGVPAGASCQGMAGGCQSMPHKLVARIRQACSMADLHKAALLAGQTSRSMNNIHVNDGCSASNNLSNSMDNLKMGVGRSCEPPIYVLSAPPIYVLACDHSN